MENIQRVPLLHGLTWTVNKGLYVRVDDNSSMTFKYTPSIIEWVTDHLPA